MMKDGKFADEYDAAQERGDVKSNGGNRSSVAVLNTVSASEIGLRRDQIRQAQARGGLKVRALMFRTGT